MNDAEKLAAISALCDERKFVFVRAARNPQRGGAMDWQHYRKAILAFLSLLATNAAASLMATGEPWPTTWGAWLRWAVTTAAGTWLVYQVRNAPPETATPG